MRILELCKVDIQIQKLKVLKILKLEDVISRLDEYTQVLDNQAKKLAENEYTQKDYEYFKS